MRHNLKIFGFIMLILLLSATFLLWNSVKSQAGGGGTVLISSSLQVGTTTELFVGAIGTRCVQMTNQYDSLKFTVDYLESSVPTLDFTNIDLTVKVNQQEVQGSITDIASNIVTWTPNSIQALSSHDSLEATIHGVNILQPNLVGFGMIPFFQGQSINTQYPFCFGWSYDAGPNYCTEYDIHCYVKRFTESGVLPTTTPRPSTAPTISVTPSPTATSGPTSVPTATPTLRPTTTPTVTPTPTPAAVSMIALGFAEDQGPIEVSIIPGQTVPIFTLTSVSASQFGMYGYPTSYGPGINTTPASGGLFPGMSTLISIQAISTVPLGTYTGFQRVTAGGSYPYALIPVTVHVVESLPTATPAPTNTPTPVPTQVPLSISNVAVANITSRTAQIRWSTSVPATSFVQYGTKLNAMNSYTTEGSTVSVLHQVDLNNLNPNKKYYYKAHSRNSLGEWVTSEVGSFTTLRR